MNSQLAAHLHRCLEAHDNAGGDDSDRKNGNEGDLGGGELQEEKSTPSFESRVADDTPTADTFTVNLDNNKLSKFMSKFKLRKDQKAIQDTVMIKNYFGLCCIDF